MYSFLLKDRVSIIKSFAKKKTNKSPFYYRFIIATFKNNIVSKYFPSTEHIRCVH